MRLIISLMTTRLPKTPESSFPTLPVELVCDCASPDVHLSERMFVLARVIAKVLKELSHNRKGFFGPGLPRRGRGGIDPGPPSRRPWFHLLNIGKVETPLTHPRRWFQSHTKPAHSAKKKNPSPTSIKTKPVPTDITIVAKSAVPIKEDSGVKKIKKNGRNITVDGGSRISTASPMKSLNRYWRNRTANAKSATNPWI